MRPYSLPAASVVLLSGLLTQFHPWAAEAASLRAPRAHRSDPVSSVDDRYAGSSPAEVEDEEDSPEDSPVLPVQPAQEALPPSPLPASPPVLAAQATSPALPVAAEAARGPPVPAAQATSPALPVATEVIRDTPAAQTTSPVPPAPAEPLSGSQHPKLPSAQSSLLEVVMPADWPPTLSKAYKKCAAPCIEGRGVCNDNVCFCKSPWTGSQCQHKIESLARFSFALVAGFCAFAIFIGFLLAKLVVTLIEGWRNERSLVRYGVGRSKTELWHPPELKTKKDGKG